jgi:hypothetical protein
MTRMVIMPGPVALTSGRDVFNTTRALKIYQCVGEDLPTGQAGTNAGLSPKIKTGPANAEPVCFLMYGHCQKPASRRLSFMVDAFRKASITVPVFTYCFICCVNILRWSSTGDAVLGKAPVL